MQELIFLKLGGSLITEKDRPHTPRSGDLSRLAGEIARARAAKPHMKLVLGHGSGSFGHTAARKYNTRQGVKGSDGWAGFVEVWKEARALNQMVVDALLTAGVPVIAFPPSASIITQHGKISSWDTSPLSAALESSLVPLVNGDVIFDQKQGGTILSTEDLFIYLAARLYPERILLAGLEEGVWADFPICQQLIASITPDNFSLVAEKIGGSASVDVTGGMIEKVQVMLSLVQEIPGLKAQIFSGITPGNVQNALEGKELGTLLYGPGKS